MNTALSNTFNAPFVLQKNIFQYERKPTNIVLNSIFTTALLRVCTKSTFKTSTFFIISIIPLSDCFKTLSSTITIIQLRTHISLFTYQFSKFLQENHTNIRTHTRSPRHRTYYWTSWRESLPQNRPAKFLLLEFFARRSRKQQLISERKTLFAHIHWWIPK